MSELLIEKYLNYGLPYLKERSEKDIKKNRMGGFKITLTDSNGKPIVGKNVHLKHKTHDFDFGCNFFMYKQYDTEEENLRYEEKWKKLFNTAVVPLYWEGTEPTEGYLRYSADAPNDVYRRPSAAAVVNWCKENGVRPKGHPLFWHEFIPRWLPEDWDTLYPLIEKRFKEISELFGKDITVFDCVNEPARIWDVDKEHPTDGWKHIIPPPDYCKTVFDLARKYFPDKKLILNEAVGAALCYFHGRYGAYYLNIKDLLSRGVSIDCIGLQCHTYSAAHYRNVFDATRLYDVLDIYSDFNKPIVLSEISIPSVFDDIKSEEVQAQAVSMLYTTLFSHKNASGIFWWNLTDDGVLCTKRKASGENLPSTGLIDGDYNEKLAYKEIDRLINKEWRTNVTLTTDKDGAVCFNGFNGEYELTLDNKVSTIHLSSETNELKKAIAL